MRSGVVFDLGETLIHFSGDWPQVFARSRSELFDSLVMNGYDLPAEAFSEEVRQRIEQAQIEREDDAVERPARELVAMALAEFGYSSVKADHLDEALRRMFAVSEAHWIPSESAAPVLRSIHQAGYRIGMISNASDGDNVRRLVEKVGVDDYVEPIVVSAEVGVRKPAPAIFEALLSAWQLPPDQLVMIGDTLNADIIGAQRVGMHQVWLRSAADRPDNMAAYGQVEPEWAIDNLAAVLEILPKIEMSE
ncbi:MAG: HAD family hydrolase [Anaerolineales bacterium]